MGLSTFSLGWTSWYSLNCEFVALCVSSRPNLFQCLTIDNNLQARLTDIMFSQSKEDGHPRQVAARPHRFSLSCLSSPCKSSKRRNMQNHRKSLTEQHSSSMLDPPPDEYALCRASPPMPSNCLPMMPNEILNVILGYLPHQALHNFRLTNSSFAELATIHLYTKPFFASTYQFAQVSTKPLLDHLDLLKSVPDNN